ncbi:MAG TPA: 2-deoxy-D-gluconate 3-dehydrogenase, partial [Desulfovibrio sp.]|nr:2-deoxy-D-gluconate 3-dehydrogenase [Desulfovibrio sp.]
MDAVNAMAAPHLIVGGDSWMGRALGAGLRSAGAEVLATSRR